MLLYRSKVMIGPRVLNENVFTFNFELSYLGIPISLHRGITYHARTRTHTETYIVSLSLTSSFCVPFNMLYLHLY